MLGLVGGEREKLTTRGSRLRRTVCDAEVVIDSRASHTEIFDGDALGFDEG